MFEIGPEEFSVQVGPARPGRILRPSRPGPEEFSAQVGLEEFSDRVGPARAKMAQISNTGNKTFNNLPYENVPMSHYLLTELKFLGDGQNH